MTKIAAVDFETFYDKDTIYSLKSMPPDLYCRDERFDPYLVSIVSNTGVRWVGDPIDAPWHGIDGYTWVSHNANFDRHVYRAWCGNDYKNWQCSANAAAYRQLPRALDKAAKVCLGREVDKSARANMKGKHWADISVDEQNVMRDYALKDSDTCLDLYNDLVPDWPEREQYLSREGIESGIYGVCVDEDLVESGLTKLRTIRGSAIKEIPWAERDKKGNMVVASGVMLAKYCRQQGIVPPESTADGDPSFERWMDVYGADHPCVAALGRWRRSNRAIRILEGIEARVREDGTIAFNLKYYGAAATGRWSGDAKLNMQNLPRKPVFGVDVRRCFVARPGKQLILADLSQIEPRCLAVLTGQTEALDAMRKGMSPYEIHARMTMGYTDSRPLKEVDPDKYLYAKVRVLGLGYQCGGDRFQSVAHSFGLELDNAESHRVVKEFRHSNPAITQYWRGLDSAFKHHRGQNWGLTLPSGRAIKYYDIASHKYWSAAITKGDTHRSFYGGKLCENSVQGLARDVFADVYWRVSQAGFRVLWSVHDELIIEVDEDDASAADAVKHIMSQSPEWLPELPLSVDIGVSKCYKK